MRTWYIVPVVVSGVEETWMDASLCLTPRLAADKPLSEEATGAGPSVPTGSITSSPRHELLVLVSHRLRFVSLDQ